MSRQSHRRLTFPSRELADSVHLDADAGRISSLLTPAYAEHAHPPIDHISSFASLCLINALHHHVYEFRSQLGVYHSIGLHIPLYKLDEPLEKGLGFEGRKNASSIREKQLTT